MRLLSFAAPWRMPILIFLSGFLLPRAFAKDTRSFIIGKARNLAWPFLLWTVIFCLVSGEPEKLLTLTPWRGGTYLWYFLFLLFYFAVALVGRRLGWPLIAAYALAIAMVMPDGSKYGERLFMLMALFFIGGFAGERPAQFVQLVSDWRALALLPIGLFLSSLSIWLHTPTAVNGAAEFTALYLAAIIGLCAVSVRIQHLRLIAPINYVGRQSIVFYLVHLPVYFLVMRAGLAELDVHPVLALAILLAAGLGAAYILSRLRSRFLLVERLFVGPEPPRFAQGIKSAPRPHG